MTSFPLNIYPEVELLDHIVILFLIFLVLSAYLSVEIVSSQLSFAGEIAHIIVVFEFPPNAFYNILVNADYL